MKMKVKDFTIVPILCPIGMKDCSGCKHAGKFSVKNPSTCGISGIPDFGEHECHYLEWFERKYEEEKKKRGA